MLRVKILFVMTWLFASTHCYGLSNKDAIRFNLLIEKVSEASRKEIADRRQENPTPNEVIFTYYEFPPILMRHLLVLSQNPEDKTSTTPCQVITLHHDNIFINSLGGVDNAITFYLEMHDYAGSEVFMLSLTNLFIQSIDTKCNKPVVYATFFLIQMIRSTIINLIKSSGKTTEEAKNRFSKIIETAIKNKLIYPSTDELGKDPLWRLYQTALRCAPHSEELKNEKTKYMLTTPSSSIDLTKCWEKDRAMFFVSLFLINFYEKQLMCMLRWFLENEKAEDKETIDNINGAIDNLFSDKPVEPFLKKKPNKSKQSSKKKPNKSKQSSKKEPPRTRKTQKTNTESTYTPKNPSPKETPKYTGPIWKPDLEKRRNIKIPKMEIYDLSEMKKDKIPGIFSKNVQDHIRMVSSMLNIRCQKGSFLNFTALKNELEECKTHFTEIIAQSKKKNLDQTLACLPSKKLEYMSCFIRQQADALRDFLFLVSRGVIPFSYLNITLLDTLPDEYPTELNEETKEKITFIYDKWCQLKASQEGQERYKCISLTDTSKEFLSRWLEHQAIAAKNQVPLDANLLKGPLPEHLNEPLPALPEPLQRVEMPKDNFCFYHALARSLPGFDEGSEGAEQVFRMITALATDLIQNHPDVANHFMTEGGVPIDEIAAQGHVDHSDVQLWGHSGMLPIISLNFQTTILVTTPASWRQDGAALQYNTNGSWELVESGNTQSIADVAQSLDSAHHQAIVLENIDDHWNLITLQIQGATAGVANMISEENHETFAQDSIECLVIILSIYRFIIGNNPEKLGG